MPACIENKRDRTEDFMSRKIVLIDGHSILNRAFYGMPDLTNSEGMHTNAVYGFLNILFKILDEEKPEYLAVAFDVHHPTFRHEMYKDYKGTRKPMPEELREQVPLMKEVLSAMGIKIMELPGYEADDILGTVSKRSEKAGMEVSIVSGDRDLLQLASDNICIRIPKTKHGSTVIEDYKAKDVVEAMGVTPTEYIDVKALMGDASDNIPGVPGIGEKTALSIIAEYHSIENAYANVENIKPNRAKNSLNENYDMAVMSKALAAINIDSPVDFSVEEAGIKDMFNKSAYEIMSRLEFKSLLAKFDTDTESGNDIEKGFKLVTDFGEADSVLNLALQSKCIGLWPITEEKKILGLSIAFSENEAYVIAAEGFITGDYLAGWMEKLFACIPKAAVMNLKEQLKLLDISEKEGIIDIGVAGYLLNPLKSTYDYDDIARDYLGITVKRREELLGKASFGRALEEMPDKFVIFAAYMSYIPYMSYDKICGRLEEEWMYGLFKNVEMPLIYSLDRMEKAGVLVKREELKEYGDKLSGRIEALEKQIYELTGEEFNINSPKQLGVILFEKLKLPHGKKTKTGYSTSADVLDKLAPEHEVVAKILEYRQLTKLKSTYADGLAAYIGDDGRIHGTFNQTITATGRISSTEPNLQNIPVRMELGREIRKVFVPKPGFVFVDADYSQIELRILAHMSGDATLIEAYNQAQDIHRITASQVFGIPLNEVTSIQRSNAKAVNFGIVYGISAFGLSEDLSISRKEALEYINQYFETYPQVKAFLDRQVEDAKTKGYVVTEFGRKRPVPEISSSNFMQRSFGERIAMNSPIQGTAADIMKIAMIRVDKRLRSEGLESKIILQVHDELVVEAPENEVSKLKKILNEEMKGAAEMKVVLEVSISTGHSWYETK